MIDDILNSKYGHYVDDITVYENGNRVVLSKIVINKDYRDSGIGTKIMEDLIMYADDNQKIIALTPSTDFGGNKNRLIQFYKRFGFKENSGRNKNYEFRSTMIRYPITMNEGKNNKIKGGIADKMSKKDIADKFNVSIQKITKELEMGSKVEMEHVTTKSLAKEIAMDHLVEIPDYYTRLLKMEKEAKKKWHIKESTKWNIKKLLREDVNLTITDETSDSTTFKIMYNDRVAGEVACGPNNDVDFAIELLFVGLLPDYQNIKLKIMNEVVSAIWKEFPNTQKILLTPLADSRGFWAKIGANRLNDSYMVILRGH